MPRAPHAMTSSAYASMHPSAMKMTSLPASFSRPQYSSYLGKTYLCIQAGEQTGPREVTMSSWQTTKFTGSRANDRKTRRLISANSSIMRSKRGSRQVSRNSSQPNVSNGHMNVVL